MEPFSPGIPLMGSGSPNNPPVGTDPRMPDRGSDSPVGATSSANSEGGRLPTVPAACLGCRSKHLKCDGQTPCTRCVSSNSECIYVASRRGYKGARKGSAANPNKRHASSSPPQDVDSGDRGSMLVGSLGSASVLPMPLTAPDSMVAPSDTNPNSPFLSSTPGLEHLQPYRRNASGLALSLSSGSASAPAHVPIPTLAERCLDSFYHHFHAAHPFVLPKNYLLRIAKDTPIEHLLSAIRYIGSLYLDVGPSRATFLEDALRLAYEPNCPRDGFLVQTLVLLLLGLDGCWQQERARQLLGDAEQIAVAIGLNTRPFAAINGRGLPVMEESWRRTWWDLFVVDGMIAGVHRHTNFLLFDFPSDVALPCEEEQYLSGSIPQPMYLEDLENRDFSGEEREFSSFAYRILAARTLGKFMRTPPIYGPEDENLSRIEALLTNWRLHLPQSKKDALNKNCKLDEMMFQGLMMTHAISIMLHQPYSQLDSSPARSVTSCAPHRMVPSGEAFNIHTSHTIRSASEISNMITHRVPLLSHSHFFTCVVTLSSIVHLSKWALFFIPHDDDDLRQQIRLNIGALNKISSVWKNAAMSSAQVKGVAQEIYRAKKAQQVNPEYWVGLTQEEMIHTIAADETIMGEIEGLNTMPALLSG